MSDTIEHFLNAFELLMKAKTSADNQRQAEKEERKQNKKSCCTVKRDGQGKVNMSFNANPSGDE